MAVNPNDVYVGAPDQATTGAVATAPYGTTLPTDATSSLNNAFVYGGYVTEDGVKLSQDYSTKDIFAWGGASVRKILDTFTGEISYSEMETNETTLVRLFGSDYVTKTAATTTAGTKLGLKIGAHLPAEQSFVFNMKDGDKKMRIVIPRGRVANYDDVQFVHNDAVSWGVTISCLDDGTGNCIYVYTDDGVKASA